MDSSAVIVGVKLLSRVRLFVIPWTVVYQASVSMGFSRQEYWSGLPFPSPGDHSWPRDRTQVSCIAGRHFTFWATSERSQNMSYRRDGRKRILSKSECSGQREEQCKDSWTLKKWKSTVQMMVPQVCRWAVVGSGNLLERQILEAYFRYESEVLRMKPSSLCCDKPSRGY